MCIYMSANHVYTLRGGPLGVYGGGVHIQGLAHTQEFIIKISHKLLILLVSHKIIKTQITH
jgi:hypothetical protein